MHVFSVASVVWDSLWPHGLYPTRLLCPWDFPGKYTGVGCHALLQVIFPTQGSNPCLLYWQVDSSPLSHWGKPFNLYNLLFIQQPYNRNKKTLTFLRSPVVELELESDLLVSKSCGLNYSYPASSWRKCFCQARTLPLAIHFFFFFNIYFYLFTWLHQVLVAACETVSCSMWDLVLQPEMEPGPPAWGVWSLSHWATREAPVCVCGVCLVAQVLTLYSLLILLWSLHPHTMVTGIFSVADHRHMILSCKEEQSWCCPLSSLNRWYLWVYFSKLPRTPLHQLWGIRAMI